MDINENKALTISANFGETFADVAKRVQINSARPITFDNGTPIELDPESEYSILMLKMPEGVLTTEEFDALTPYLFGGIAQAVMAGVLSPTRIADIATIFTIAKQPQFTMEIPEGYSLKVYWDGMTTFRYALEADPVPLPEEEEGDEGGEGEGEEEEESP